MSTLRRLVAPVVLSVAVPCVGTRGQIALDREPPGPSSRTTGLAITEIMYNPRPVQGGDTNRTLEFLEVYNSKPWAEDLSGFAVDGTVHYDFPSNTVLEAGGYLVVARVPELVRTNYGITNVVGPWDGAASNRLSTERGVVRLRHRQGAVLLSVNYADSPPWPEAADGTGHSLVLARPSHGEDDVRAWAQSNAVGGSPGGPDPVPAEPLAPVCINEWQNHSDPEDWIELYNHSNQPVDVSGAWLTDDPATNKWRIPDGTVLPARGFRSWTQNQLGFQLFAGGETIFLVNSNQTRVIDVIDFRGQSNNVSSGRSPDGGPHLYGLATRTQGAANSRPMRYPVVITEIMYHPLSGNTDDEYLEIHNRTARTVDLSGWEFVVGITYTFPTNAIVQAMPPGAYWVVAKNPTNLFGIYTNLTTNNTFGPYTGTLANGGERVVLAAADYDRVSSGGQDIMEKLPVPVSDVSYGDGGKWGSWSDGAGSSLELIDAEADGHHPSNWADSSNTGESPWTAIEGTVPLGEALGTEVNDALIVMLQDEGECLVDELEVRVGNGPNLVAHGGFEEPLNAWSLQGSHDFSTVEPAGFAGNRSLHLRAASRGDNQSNRILSAPFAHPIPAGTAAVSLRVKAKWLRGCPELLLRLHGSATEVYGRMALPRALGTPGLPNSRRVANAGPAVHAVRHAPLLPAAGQPVAVTARATDPQGLASMILRHRLDPAPAFDGIPMLDDGTGGDAVAGDGLYSATIPGHAEGAMAAFYVEARDPQNAIGTFPAALVPEPGLARCWPNDAVARECVVRWGEPQMPGDFATYHLWVTSANSNRWHTRDAMNNAPMDGTFVYNASRVIYNALPLYSGSPWHRTNALTGPAGLHRTDYELNFPDDDPLLGATDFVLNNPGNPNVTTVSDLSAVAEQTVYCVFEGMGMPFNHRRYIHFFVNGSQRSLAFERPGHFIFEDSQQPNGSMIEQWFPNDAGGPLFKLDDWFEFEPNGFDVAAYDDADLTRRMVCIDGQPTLVAASYRFMFRKRSVNAGSSENDYAPIFALINAASPADNPTHTAVDPDLLGTVVDWEAWMRHFAVQRAVGNWDSYGWERGKNDYLYQGAAGGFVHLPWDIDYSLGLGKPADAPLFDSNDPRVRAMFNTPAIQRAYWRAFAELVDGPFRNAHLDPFIDARVAALTRNLVDIDLDAVAAIKTYVADRRAFLQSQLATVATPFTLEGPPTLETTNNLLVVRGLAPVAVKDITLNGTVYPVTWTSATHFILRTVLAPGLNVLTLAGLDRLGAPVPDAARELSVIYTGPAPEPRGALVFSELLFAPASADAQFIELLNRSDLNFDLTGWQLDGAGFTFPTGSIVAGRETVLLVRDRGAFRAAYGNLPVLGAFRSTLPSTRAHALALVRPGPEGGEVIGAIRYEVAAPWPEPVAGASLQLIDPAQDNRRPSNWAMDTNAWATPGAPNSVAGSLPPYDPLWLNELQVVSLIGPADNTGEAEPWLELHNADDLPVSLDGYFLADNYTTNLTRWPFPPGLTLEAGDHRVLWLDGEPAETTDAHLHAGFRAGDGGQLALVRLVGGTPQITDHMTWTGLGANLSYGSWPEGQPVFRQGLSAPTPGETNAARPRPIVINEFLALNSAGLRDPADLDRDDWIELYNAGADPVDLAGFHLTDDPVVPAKFRVPGAPPRVLAPGGFLLMWADDEVSQNRTDRDLHLNFKLSGSGGFIGLYAPDGFTPVDTLHYGEQVADLSEGRYGDGASMRYLMPRPTPKTRNAIADYNTAPSFPVIPDTYAVPGQIITLTIRATDPDGHIMTYAVDAGPPESQLNQSGLYRWIVPTNQPPGDYIITLRVTDSGSPPRSDVTTFRILVRPPGTPTPASGPEIRAVAATQGQATFTFATTPGRAYRVLYQDDPGAATWHPLGPVFVAGSPTASLTDPMVAPQRFYRVQQLD
ncbi:MAG: lamin tail domain-containing protein [Verrucomicrobia bacterium]|nr:lamin tail domain-containing protein [Verrucomicrobiota bacterium]